jgi:hypothetical protein
VQQPTRIVSFTDYAHIFDLLTKLRQSTLHPYLVVYSASGNKCAPGSALFAADTEANAPTPGADAANILHFCDFFNLDELICKLKNVACIKQSSHRTASVILWL